MTKEALTKMTRSRHLFRYLPLLLLTFWLAFFSLSTSAATRPASTPDFAVIDSYVLSQMNTLHIPGIALGIVHGKQIVHVRGFGIADPSGRSVTSQTSFSISSMTKSFTAVAIMQLVEQGKVVLDAPVQRYLPWFRVATPGVSGKITVRNLLNHTSGIPISAGREVLTGSDEETTKQAVQALSTVELFAPPGTAFQYSNLNYVTLGLVIQVASEQSYETYMQQHVFAPLQMQDSFTSYDQAMRNGMATGYRWWFGVPLPDSNPLPKKDLGAGGVITSAKDMTHYLIAQLNGGSYEKTSILEPASVALLHRPAVLASTTTDQYGMGWYTYPFDGETILYHGGDDPQFHTDMALLPRDQWGIVVLTNANSDLSTLSYSTISPIAAGVIDLLLGQQPHASGLGSDKIYLIADAVVGILSALALWSVIRVVRGWRRPLKRIPLRLLPLLWEVALPIGLLVELPNLAGASWELILLYLPDIGFWLLGMFLLLFITGIARSARVVRSYGLLSPRRRPAPFS